MLWRMKRGLQQQQMEFFSSEAAKMEKKKYLTGFFCYQTYWPERNSDAVGGDASF